MNEEKLNSTKALGVVLLVMGCAFGTAIYPELVDWFVSAFLVGLIVIGLIQ